MYRVEKMNSLPCNYATTSVMFFHATRIITQALSLTYPKKLIVIVIFLAHNYTNCIMFHSLIL